ncbi:MAG TPA: Rne/Rng family ribonuclease [Parvularculaceae bacterium]|nr:Rne/Rng family ribonuclease [Parvularculaceae bacterium]
MTKTMLIDAAHPEEVRVCVLENGKVEDFDFESSARKPLRGNIYLARVTRVEPSLQAAFVEYGGNRHGFLAFNEIHPDYYQIPVSDRQILQEAEAEEASLAAELELEQHGDERAEEDFDLVDLDGPSEDADGPELRGGESERPQDDDEHAEPAAAANDDEILVSDDDGADAAVWEGREFAATPTSVDEEISAPFSETSGDDDEAPAPDEIVDIDADNKPEDVKKGRARSSRRTEKRGDLLERYKEARRRRARLVRNYKIQEVVKRRQILLVQVVKEERGNKGAALTTYLSLAGRYCVLMPNTARGGGISRKIPVAADRKRLRRVVDSLEVPQGMGLIIRTAGAKRTKAEIKRDYDYLIRLWESIRSLTLKSIAPCLIYEEASLIKRAIRDLYDKDIDKVLVDGDFGYREAKDFMKMLMPSHAKNVQPYKEQAPLFIRHGVEGQLDAMYQPVVRLKSGGYLVIHQTEALVAIDVNSGKSTRERNIELTALKTNLEAPKEAARQCRLRDLAGLIVIDFIDMEENKNNRAVEKRLRDSMKSDRARVQLGRISNFGLLEMSRQRRRSSIVEGTTHSCPTCGGAGVVRSHEMAALRILRAVESEAIAGRAATISIKAALEVTLYILNHKRAWLKRIEDDYALTIEIIADSTKAGDFYEVEKRGAARELPDAPSVVRADAHLMEESVDDEEVAPEEIAEEAAAETSAESEGGGRRRRRRRRRRHDEPSSRTVDEAVASEPQSGGEDRDQSAGQPLAGDAGSGEADGQRRRRRRGRRGGKRNRRGDEAGRTMSVTQRTDAEPAQASPSVDAPAAGSMQADNDEAELPVLADERLQPQVDVATPAEREESEAANGHSVATMPAPAPDAPALDDDANAPPAGETIAQSTERKSSRKGWWQRALGG